MRDYSVALRCSPLVLPPALLLAACVSSHLDDPSQAVAGSDDARAVVAEVGGCGNGRIDADEDCEVGLPGWTNENCSASCRQTLYPNSNLCTFEIGESLAFYERGNCADLPGFDVACFYLFGQYCQILCESAEDCPRGFTCNPTSHAEALGPGWCVPGR